MHARTQIREAVKTILTGLATTGSNVHASRVTPFDRATELPSLNIHITDEEFDRGADSGEMGDIQTRAIEIMVEGRLAASGTDNVDDNLDGVALEVEQAMIADRTLGGTVFFSEYQGTELSLDDETETLVGVVTLSYAGLYRIDASDPETIL